MTNSKSKQEYTTVGDLIDQLQRFDSELPVSVNASGAGLIQHPLFAMGRDSMKFGHTGYRPCVEIRIGDGDPGAEEDND